MPCCWLVRMPRDHGTLPEASSAVECLLLGKCERLILAHSTVLDLVDKPAITGLAREVRQKLERVLGRFSASPKQFSGNLTSINMRFEE